MAGYIGYFDYNATTPIAPEVAQAMQPFWASSFGNSFSPHRLGDEARRAVSEARDEIARAIGASPREIIFTSGATESNNAVFQSVLFRNSKYRRILISAVEHASVRNVALHAKKTGAADVAVIPVDRDGNLDLEIFRKESDKGADLVSLMWVNNETGVVFPIEKLAEIAKSKGMLFHVDAAQAVGKLDIDLSRIPIDFLSLSAHKFYGPKGIGILFARKDVPFHPLLLGGHQERDRRAGTHNVPAIVGMAKAIEWTNRFFREKGTYLRALRDRLEHELLGRIPNAFVNGRGADRAWNTLNITIPGISSSSLITRLSEQGIFVSGGSACMSGALLPSHVLLAMGLSEDVSLSSIRFSLGCMNTEGDVTMAVEAVPALVAELRELGREEVVKYAD